MKDLTFFAIQYGGVPMTLEGAKRFIFASKSAGHKVEDIEKYLQLPKGTIQFEKVKA